MYIFTSDYFVIETKWILDTESVGLFLPGENYFSHSQHSLIVCHFCMVMRPPGLELCLLVCLLMLSLFSEYLVSYSCKNLWVYLLTVLGNMVSQQNFSLKFTVFLPFLLQCSMNAVAFLDMSICKGVFELCILI